MDSFSDLIDQFGGAPVFAEKIGVPDSHARTMKARNSIPPEYWPAVVREAAIAGIAQTLTIESLLALRSSRKSGASA